jgi:tripartite-type tricarboxylate transporter receptor subunit TctC
MLRLRRLGPVLATLAAAVALSSLFGVAQGADYPTKNINFIIPYGPGGTTDPFARQLALASEPLLKGKFVMVNKPGAEAMLGTAEVVQAKPDGYTIGVTDIGAVALAPQTSKLPYNGPEDYQPIIRMTWNATVLVVKADAPWKTLAEFTAEAKMRPGQLKIGLSGPLSPGQIALTYYNKLAGIEVNFVPFTGGGGESITNLLGGHLDACAATSGTARAHVAAKKIRVLATVPGNRNPLYPDAPSMKELGFDFATPVNQFLIIAPKGMSRELVDRLYKVFAEAMKTPAVQQFALNSGLIIDPLGPEETANHIREMWKIYAKVIKDFNVEVRK